MSEFFYLIPVSLALGALGLAVFLWSLKANQYEDLDGAAERVLFEEDALISPRTKKEPGNDVPGSLD